MHYKTITIYLFRHPGICTTKHSGKKVLFAGKQSMNENKIQIEIEEYN
jgi:hypothetical protein